MVVHHDFSVRAAVGATHTVSLGIPSLTLASLRHAELATAMRTAQPGAGGGALARHAAGAARSLKRTLSSGEDIIRAHAPPPLGSPDGVDGGGDKQEK